MKAKLVTNAHDRDELCTHTFIKLSENREIHALAITAVENTIRTRATLGCLEGTAKTIRWGSHEITKQT